MDPAFKAARNAMLTDEERLQKVEREVAALRQVSETLQARMNEIDPRGNIDPAHLRDRPMLGDRGRDAYRGGDA